MFDFQRLTVYKKARAQHLEVFGMLKQCRIDPVYHNQYMKASLSIALNIAEGSGRLTAPDRRRFFIIARSSVFECVSLIEILSTSYSDIRFNHIKLQKEYEELSRLLYVMIRNLEKKC